MQFNMDHLKGLLVDGVFRLPAPAIRSPQIVIVAYDDASSVRYGFGGRFPVDEMEAVFKQIALQYPVAVGVIGVFNEKNYTRYERNRLEHIFRSVPHTVIGFSDDESLGRSEPAVFSNDTVYVPGIVSRDAFSFGGDSVTRRVMLKIDAQPTLFSVLAQRYCSRKGPVCSPDDLGGERLGNSTQAYINWRPGKFKVLSSQRVAAGDFELDYFKGKIVLVGTELTARQGADHIFTPYSRQELKTSLLQGAAHSLATLIEKQPISRSPRWVDWLVVSLVGLVTVNFVLAVSPRRGIFFVFAECVALVIAGWVLLRGFEVWLNLAHPLVTACVSYYLVIPYRLVEEYRKRWHYQEKSELMAQLEQLKSNFLSLVSHDLKTPIARIQGNAELVLDAAVPVTDKQRKSLTAIIKTTEDLSQYVESILDLTRVESARIPLSKSTRDINSTVIDVVKEKRPLAKERQIELVTYLDPIFSIRYDVKLMHRVVGNLVDNAIQYSPCHSRISVSSREDNQWVRISVRDQGVGIGPDDREKVFTKFYRCHNEETKNVTGTGLGLYLVKYFVELHNGVVELESELGVGSTFTVALPAS